MKILGYSELYERWGVSPSVLYVWKARGKLPPPDVQWSKSPGWKESTIRRVEKDLGLRRTDGETGTGDN